VEAGVTEGAALVPLTDKQLKQRIELNKAARFGLQDASAAQLNVIFVLCKRWKLDPVTDITLLYGMPWVTIDGHLRTMRRHPEYRGFKQRPLSTDEKKAWGYAPDDLVVESTIHTASWGDITQWGKVTRAEVDEAARKKAPLGVHPVEIAQKRSLARAQRAAFGLDTPTDEDIAQEMAAELEQRNNPERIEASALEYDRVFAPFIEEDRPQPQADASTEPDQLDQEAHLRG
jgi:hypothetical protein